MEKVQDLVTNLRLPDLWQQQAIRGLQAGRDVLVDAPTGSGKTYIFELLVEAGLKRSAVYTVPTRALANDKLLEWRRRNWNVGIATGDIAENLDAPVVVATLETQKQKLVRGQGPGLLVVDEYQMLGDHSRGVNYELAIGLASPETQLLLLSGSVGNSADVVAWLRRLGRNVELVRHTERPVPLEEVHVDALPDRIPDTVRGFWPRAIAKVLKAGMGPLLVFAPRRRAAEQLARQLSACLPEEDPLLLTSEQKHLAGDLLAKLLRSRIAFHHSGLDYRQRAGLIEPLAKAGQLRLVVATMGLSSGINFSLRSVLVSDREYRAHDSYHLVRPDELLQMFGRAGRRGLDKKGYIIVAPGKPRLSEARPLQLKRARPVDWPAMLGLMHDAVVAGRDPREAAQQVAQRLFSEEPMDLGFNRLRARRPEPAGRPAPAVRRQTYVEMLNSEGKWERRRAPTKSTLARTLVHDRERWRPALSHPRALEQVAAGVGVICRLGGEPETRYGRELPLAHLGAEDQGELVLTKWLHRRLRTLPGVDGPANRREWTLELLESEVIPLLPALTGGGTSTGLVERNGTFSVRLDFSEAPVFAVVDSLGRALLDPPSRQCEAEVPAAFSEVLTPATRAAQQALSGGNWADAPVECWHRLGLIDELHRPTRRGTVFSFFNQGEGLAIAAALEDPTYPLEELVYHLANLRAGHRFSEHEEYSGRLGHACRAAYHGATYPGYLSQGVPPDYGDGAAEILAGVAANPSNKNLYTGEELLSGDIERAQLEWRSLLQHISHSPNYDWDRWRQFRLLAIRLLEALPPRPALMDFPPLTAAQRQRHKSFLRFD